MATQPHLRDAIRDDEHEGPGCDTRFLPSFVRIGIALIVGALAIMAHSKL